MACEAYLPEWDEPCEAPDDVLVAGILAGEERSFEALYDRYRGRIFAFAVKRLSDAAEAEDVTQEVFLQVHRCLASFEGRSSLLTWMFGIAHNQVCRRFRKKTPPMISLDEPDAIEVAGPSCPPDRQVDAGRVLRRCRDVVDEELTDAQRKVFRLRYWENRSTGSIAKQLGKSNQAIKISLFRSRRVLLDHAGEVENLLSA